MFDISKIEVADTTTVHLKDANGAKLYEDGAPLTITLYGPGSSQFEVASDARLGRSVERRKRKGDKAMSGAELREENVQFLADCTAGCSANLAPPEQAGREYFAKLYSNRKVGFWFDQLNGELGDWASFTGNSPTA